MSVPFGTREVEGVTLRDGPAREDCFECVDADAEMHDWPEMSEIARRERLHRHMNNECGALEIASQCLVDFPEAPWGLRLNLARQAADEARHAAVLRRRIDQLYGYKGEFPVNNFEWAITMMVDDLPGRLAIENRTFEAGLIDILGSLRDVWREAGDSTTADVLDAMLADEINHVRFGNRWIREMTEKDPTVLLKVAKAIRKLATAIQALASEAGEENAVGVTIGKRMAPAVYVQGRLEADFTEEEVKEVLRLAGFRSIIPHELG